jgi:hypothetical protein
VAEERKEGRKKGRKKGREKKERERKKEREGREEGREGGREEDKPRMVGSLFIELHNAGFVVSRDWVPIQTGPLDSISPFHWFKFPLCKMG